MRQCLEPKLTLGQHDLSSLAVSQVIVDKSITADIGQNHIENRVVLYFSPKLLLKIVTTGGDVVLLYASKYHGIRTVVNVSGRYDLQRGIEERLGKDFVETIKKEGYLDVKNKTGNFLILIMCGE